LVCTEHCWMIRYMNMSYSALAVSAYYTSIISIKLIIRLIFRFVRILDLRITCGRTRGRWLPNPLMTWVISFVLPCVLDGFHTSVVTTQKTPRPVPAMLREMTCWCSPIESMLLLAATNTDLPWWMMRLAWFLQWIPTQIEKKLFCNNGYNYKNN